MREQFVLHVGRQGVELRIEVRMEDDFPGHDHQYDSRNICRQAHGAAGRGSAAGGRGGPADPVVEDADDAGRERAGMDREWLEQGRAQGIEQGVEQGRHEERALLCRLAARKFDVGAAEGLAAALADVTDPDRLARVGDWIIECATASELLARIRGDNGSGG